MPLAADNPTDRVKQLIVLTDRLSDLVEKETELLKERRPSEIQAFHDERTKLSNIYVQEMQLISKDKGLIEGVKDDLTAALKAKTGKFREKLDEHGRLLYRIRDITEGIIRAIAEDVQEKTKSQAGYSKDAGVSNLLASRPATLSLDETI